MVRLTRVLRVLGTGLGYRHVQLLWVLTLGGLIFAQVMAVVLKTPEMAIGFSAGPIAVLPFAVGHHLRMAVRHLRRDGDWVVRKEREVKLRRLTTGLTLGLLICGLIPMTILHQKWGLWIFLAGLAMVPVCICFWE